MTTPATPTARFRVPSDLYEGVRTLSRRGGVSIAEAFNASLRAYVQAEGLDAPATEAGAPLCLVSVRVSPELLAEARALAASRGESLSGAVAMGLRGWVAAGTAP